MSGIAAEKELSWSCRSSAQFRLCRRAWCFHYFDASGGADEFSPELVRKIHALRSLCDVSEYVSRIFSAALRKFFYESLPVSGLKGFLLRQWGLELEEMLSYPDMPDHRRPMLLELYYRERPVKMLDEYVRNELTKLACGVVSGGDFAGMQSLPPEYRRGNGNVMNVCIGTILCRFSPLAVYFDGRELHFTEASAKDAGLRSLLHCYAALEHFRIPPDRVVSERLDFSTGKLAVFRPENWNLSESLQALTGEYELMRSCSGSAFQYSPDRQEHCRICRFRELCEINHE